MQGWELNGFRSWQTLSIQLLREMPESGVEKKRIRLESVWTNDNGSEPFQVRFAHSKLVKKPVTGNERYKAEVTLRISEDLHRYSQNFD
jgi:hypothetical protein